MAEINLEDLLKAKAQENTAAAAPVAVIDQQQEIMQVTQQTETLTPAERKQVEEIKSKIDLMNSGYALQFGSGAQKNMADFSDSLLSQVRTKDSGEVGALLTDLSGKINEFNRKESDSFVKKLPLIGALVSKGETMLASYEKLSTKVDKIQSELEKSKTTMMKDIMLFDALYQKNLEYFKHLELYIRAGEEKLVEMRSTVLPKLRADAAASADPMAGQVVSDFESNVDRFEKKVHDLKISKTIAIQTAPQLRLIQNNDKILVERVQSAIYNAIPLWKNQIVIALGLTRQQNVLKMQQAISDTTNELLKRNAEMLKINSIETAKENNRSIVDIETVKKVNDDLVTTIEETLKIQQEGRQARQSAEQELLQIENRLKETLLANMNR
ncbi:toxic anion resistance protein [Veillonellaceae bacterium WCA-693-APC-5D-A]|uniref:Toxic anion resistance protein n=2 Tax=Anaerovibrio slackiae TaxID=2652309 RepID=A0A6I2UD36_9FIRM|nr:toxic anion resistance protein [Anaerovibrio slackiae]MBR0358780.1 toxic anion resistance protein [Selenomonadaceae bacterium]MCI6483777.1 toxic anion resistance protein [Selenomonadaceae bacterium]MSU09458.1 toxic anion resistance protein [Anaerovibrio slackiae]